MIFSQCEDYLIGDINNDNSLDVIDIIMFVDIIFENEITDSNITDLNFDFITNIFDIIILVERILNEPPYPVSLLDVEFDFHNLLIDWQTTNDYGFQSYNIYYSNFIDNTLILLYSTTNVDEHSVIINDVIFG